LSKARDLSSVAVGGWVRLIALYYKALNFLIKLEKTTCHKI
jgi:hypothetical protein